MAPQSSARLLSVVLKHDFPPSLVVALELEGVDGAGLDNAASVVAPLLLGLLVAEVLASDLSQYALRLEAVALRPKSAHI